MFDFKSYEFYEFIEEVSKNFSSKLAADNFRKIYPFLTEDEIVKEQRFFDEAIRISEEKKYIKNDDEIYLTLKTLFDEKEDYDHIDFLNLANFLTYISELKSSLVFSKKLRYLKTLVESLNTHDDLKELINISIDTNGEIKDNATPELASIRRELLNIKSRVKRSLQSIFTSKNASKFIMEDTISIRNGRYTINCKPNFHQYIEGIIQDRSVSGQSFYIEPSSIVAINNILRELLAKEDEELTKIIRTIIMKFKSEIDSLKDMVASYSLLAKYIETGFFYRNKDITFSTKTDEIYFKEVHHPLLYFYLNDSSVAIDIHFEKEKNLLLITGPNTGGKTAALKSIGLNLLIIYCGLPVFAKVSHYVIFDNIFADIGDKQSLAMSLSTFSSHILNIADIISKADGNSFIAFDELGTGTEAREGASLAIAIIKYLQKAGAKVAVSTHFVEVKNFALNTNTATIYAVDFDYETLMPRYRLLKDIVGKSDPILIAKQLGFLDEIIEEAKQELSNYKNSIEVTIEEINRLKAENNHKERALKVLEEELAERVSKLDSDERKLSKRLGSKEADLLDETYALLSKAKRLAQDKAKHNIGEIEKDIEVIIQKREKVNETFDKIDEIKVNDIIFLERYKQNAVILSIDNDVVTVAINSLKVKIKRNEIVGLKIEDKREKPLRIITTNIDRNIRHEIVLVGKRVEEALDLLDTFLDKAISSNYDKVYIVHGRGTGQLRKAIHEHLRTHISVKKYRLGENPEGGMAVTVAEI